jgi:hypothetical protein
MNNYYLVLFVDEYNEDKIKEILNLEKNIGFCSLVYKPEYKYDFNTLLNYVKSIDKKYPWKLHEITIEDYSITESIDVVLDTNIRKNQTDHYIVFKNYLLLDEKFIDSVNDIYENNKKVDAIMKKDDENNGFTVSFSTHMILNKNNQDTLVQKLLDNDKEIHYL